MKVNTIESNDIRKVPLINRREKLFNNIDRSRDSSMQLFMKIL